MLGQHPIQTIHREALLDNASHNPDDSQAPANLLNALRSVRIGIGHDTHRLKPGGPLRLGGIDIAHDFSLDGHSDADVLLHAVTDAILGAAAIGDIGELFPKLSSYKPTIAKRIAEILDIEADKVGVKAKTGEGVGAVGKNEIMMAQCVALLAKTT